MATISMYRASIPVFKHILNSLNAVLDKAVASADARKIEHNTLLSARLAPDMYPLVRQVQIATDNVKGCAARLAGIEIPKYEDNETTFAELKARIVKTIAFIEGIKPEQIDDSEERQIVLKFPHTTLEFRGLDYLVKFATPNIYFHVTTAYGILRHNGVDIGKRDFMGG